MTRLREIDYMQFSDTYQSKYFDEQVAHKFLIELEDKHVIETTAYFHYNQKKPKALAIDISTMVGCPMDCRFCESSSINYKRKLTTPELLKQVDFIFERFDHTVFPQVMLSFQGIGEPSLVASNIIEFAQHYTDAKFSISIATMGYNIEAFEIWRNSGLKIANLQLSYAGENQYKLIPMAPPFSSLLREATLCVESNNFTQVKFNYILIKGVTDTPESIAQLVAQFSNTSVIVKISSLNETSVSRKNNLESSTLEKAKEIHSLFISNNINSYIYGSFNASKVGCGQLAFLKHTI